MQGKSSTLKARAYTIIKKKIVRCELAPGSPISEKDLMVEIGVSRTPIREALSLLENENLVTVFPKRGVFVTDITEKELNDIYTMRICLESAAVKLAAPNLDERGDIDRYLEIYGKKDGVVSFEQHLEIDREFHLLFARGTRNDYMIQAIVKMYDLNSRIRFRLISYNQERVEQSRQEHLALLRHLKEGEIDRAAEVMQRHIRAGMQEAKAVPWVVPAAMPPALS